MSVRYRAINYKGKREFLYDENGTYVRQNGKFVKADKIVVKDPEEELLKKEFSEYVKGKPYLKNRVKYIKNVKKKLYYAKVWWLTEQNDLTVLKNHERRQFKGFHLDHIFPISVSFERNIPPEIVSNIKNLRFIHHKKNMKKSNLITEEAENIMKELMSNS